MTVQLPIVSVTVHPDGAIVTRQGQVVLADDRCVISRLPLLLEPDSLRVQVIGGDLVQARLDLDLPFEDRAEAVEEQRAWLDNERALAGLQAEVAHLENVRDAMQGLAATFDPEGPVPTAAGFAAWADLDAELGRWAEETDARLRKLENTEETLLEKRLLLQAALGRRSSEALWQRWAPTHRLDLDARGEAVEVVVSYAIRGALWTPAYAMDLDPDFQNGRFSMRALIGQATGEDWSGVRISVSTGSFARSVDLPSLKALRIGTVQPPKPTGWRPLPADLDAMFPPVELERSADVSRSSTETLSFGDDEDDMDDKGYGQMDVVPLAAPQMVSRSAKSEGPVGALSGLASAAFDLAEGAFGGGAPAPEPARRPASGAMPGQSNAAPKKRLAPLRPPTGVRGEQLDYGALRVHGPDSGHGLRGRLHRLEPSARFAARGLPPNAWQRWRNAEEGLLEGMHTLLTRPLPPHHVLPEELDGGHVGFDAPGTVDIPADGRFHAATLFVDDAEIALSYRAVPRVDTRVFRQVEARTSRSGPLPPGPLEASIEGALEIVAPFDGAAGDAAVQFGLGAEDRLSLVRNVRYDEQSAGMLGGSRRFLTEIEVEVASAMEVEVRIEVLERIPVPLKSGSPEFAETEASPRTEAYEGEDDEEILEGGRRQWLNVSAGSTGMARLAYAVTMSNKEEISGGDRRG